ncbi:MAG: hypothetical protein NTX52_14400, partial [Planctomycetota bacterium]|nr:hypothetical protein [Planctomycetota bacterium]
GRGQLMLRNANIATDLFYSGHMAEIEDMNREFIRFHDSHSSALPITPTYLTHSSRRRADAQVTTLNLKVLEEKNVNETNALRIADAGIFLWQEADTDAFWLRFFLVPMGSKMPRIRIMCDHPFEVRDFSHSFLAKDNLLWTEQQSDFTTLYKRSTIVTKVFRPRPGEENNRYCRAYSVPLINTPVRGQIERAINTLVYIEPRDFLTYKRLTSATLAKDDSVFGLWLFCRLSDRVIHFPGTLKFQIQSNIGMDFFRFQVLLPRDVKVAFNQCATSNNLFMPWVNSNPNVNLPGYFSLVDIPDGSVRNIPVCYTIQAPFFQGKCTLVCRRQK